MSTKIIETIARVLHMPHDWRESPAGRFIMATAIRQALWG